ncbi:hypothetical protein BDP81DRAFT_400888 [Colletotrichum phormii]|uniref:Uncharacterized protein n=1 Tax=Colletotrichum phormii TaxID=359342 RepID=A0AAI9ZCF8_9PEZI|nr:uncharacterized protein BDP81DRAFT_400888 [Colletotrichum phormii]KAK1621727.1 hypothetical protein BDP81DRAFT_400888 [Colletotrichum phormii]
MFDSASSSASDSVSDSGSDTEGPELPFRSNRSSARRRRRWRWMQDGRLFEDGIPYYYDDDSDDSSESVSSDQWAMTLYATPEQLSHLPPLPLNQSNYVVDDTSPTHTFNAVSRSSVFTESDSEGSESKDSLTNTIFNHADFKETDSNVSEDSLVNISPYPRILKAIAPEGKEDHPFVLDIARTVTGLEQAVQLANKVKAREQGLSASNNDSQSTEVSIAGRMPSHCLKAIKAFIEIAVGFEGSDTMEAARKYLNRIKALKHHIEMEARKQHIETETRKLRIETEAYKQRIKMEGRKQKIENIKARARLVVSIVGLASLVYYGYLLEALPCVPAWALLAYSVFYL